ncbi:MAG: ABC transporter permease [Candidatus Eisenbacteria sp.]|nr:ABC transporter permease [Candidatus Eisenbacteria bacterium]
MTIVPVMSLARHTFIDALRERAFVVLGLFLVVILVAARLLSPLALGEGRRVTLDVGLASVGFFGFLLVALLGTRMVHKEIDCKTILVLLSKPIRRSEFVLGKFLGLVTVVAVSLIAMLLMLAGILLTSGYEFDATLAVAGYYAFLELLIMAALAMFLTAFTSPVLSTFFLMGLFVAGHLSGSLIEMAQLLPNACAAKMLEAIFYVLPRLDLYSYTLEVVHGLPVDGGQLLWATSYAVIYSVGVLLLSVLILRSREFS